MISHILVLLQNVVYIKLKSVQCSNKSCFLVILNYLCSTQLYCGVIYISCTSIVLQFLKL